MSEKRYLRDLKLNGKPVWECQLEIECNGGLWRLYRDVGREKTSAIAVSLDSYSSEYQYGWDDPDVTVDVLFSVVMYRYGNSHLYFNKSFWLDT